MTLVSDTLRVRFNPQQPAAGDQIVRDAAVQLQALIESGQLSGGPLLKIDGPASIPVAYTIAHQLAHRYGAIAVCDPKIGERGEKVYIVTVSHSQDYQLGDLLKTEAELSPVKNLKIVVCGPNLSDNAALTRILETGIKQLNGAPYPYRLDPIPAYGESMNSTLVEKLAVQVSQASAPLLLIQAGCTSLEGARPLLEQATHSIVIGPHSQETSQWQTFCDSLNLPLLARIEIEERVVEGQLDKGNLSGLPSPKTMSSQHLSFYED